MADKSKKIRELEDVRKKLANLEFRLDSFETSFQEMNSQLKALTSTVETIQSGNFGNENALSKTSELPKSPSEKDDQPETLTAEELLTARLSLTGQMASSLAHELSRPLTNILTFAQALYRLSEQDKLTREDLHPSLERIIAQAEFGAKFITRLRRFLSNNNMQREQCQLNDLVKDSLQLCESEFRDHSITLELNLEPSLPQLLIDPLGIQQVIINLIRNAVDAMANTPVPQRQLMISTQWIDDEIRLSVCDNGEGLSVETINELFQPFRSTKSEGMGIGLSLCREIMHQHDGRISCQQNPERGVTFIIALPFHSGKELKTDDSTSMRIPRG